MRERGRALELYTAGRCTIITNYYMRQTTNGVQKAKKAIERRNARDAVMRHAPEGVANRTTKAHLA